MKMKWILNLIVFGVVALSLRSSDCFGIGQGPIGDRVNSYLSNETISQGVITLEVELNANPENDELRFGLGFLQFAQAVETLGQSWYRYGIRSHEEIAMMIPVLRLPVPANPNPEPVSNQQARAILQRFVDDLMVAEKMLSQIKSETVQLGLHIGRAYLDFDGDGKPGEQEALWRIYANLNRRVRVTPQQAADFMIKLDAGDVHWLRGYCHLISGFLEFYLAHDDARLFDHTAHLFFTRPASSYPFLNERGPNEPLVETVLDAIALIHLIDLPVTDAKRCQAARDHFKEVIRLSRQTWDLYEKEMDDDHEWIPNPRQTGVIPGVKVSPEMIQQWRAFLDEAEGILDGTILIPFWRGSPEKPLGVNLKRVFTEPKRFDLVLWVQGTGAAPYREEGTLTEPDFWRRLMETFNGNFVGFALWFN